MAYNNTLSLGSRLLLAAYCKHTSFHSPFLPPLLTFFHCTPWINLNNIPHSANYIPHPHHHRQNQSQQKLTSLELHEYHHLFSIYRRTSPVLLPNFTYSNSSPFPATPISFSPISPRIRFIAGVAGDKSRQQSSNPE